MKMNTGELYNLIQETKRVKQCWRQTGREWWRLYYEVLYMQLGSEALDRTQTVVECPAALRAMYLLAKDVG